MRRIVNSPTGRVLVAIRDNESRVSMIGYNPAIYRSVAFMISGLVAGLAGALNAVWNLGATPNMASALTTINALIITILGGMGTLIGPILGAGIMQFISQFFFRLVWRPLAAGVWHPVYHLVIFLPYGIVGTYRMRRLEIRAGWKRLLGLLTGKKN